MKAKEIYNNNKTLLINYRNNAASEMQQLIDYLLLMEKTKEDIPKAELTINIGKQKCKDVFLPVLSSIVDNPITSISSYKNQELQILIRNKLHNINIILLNLTAVKNLKVEVWENESYKQLFASFSYCHNDYNIYLTIYN